MVIKEPNNSINKMTTTKTIEMFYDEYECDFGDGFYPVLTNDPGFKNILITFSQEKIPPPNEEIVWKQKSGGPIFGLDGTTGPDLLKVLNELSDATTITKIFDLYGRKIHPKRGAN